MQGVDGPPPSPLPGPHRGILFHDYIEAAFVTKLLRPRRYARGEEPALSLAVAAFMARAVLNDRSCAFPRGSATEKKKR